MSSDNPDPYKACCDNCRFVHLKAPNPGHPETQTEETIDLCLRFPKAELCPTSRWCGEHDLSDRIKQALGNSRQGKQARDGRDFTAE